MATLPKPTLVRPSVLAGHRNGLLPAELLRPTKFGGARTLEVARRSFDAFAAVELEPRGLVPRNVGGYRDLRGQLSLFLGRYEPVPAAVYWLTPAARRKTWSAADRAATAAALGVTIPDATYWCKRQNRDGSYPATAAVPGYSNHGLGLAIDVAEERNGDPFPEPLSPDFLGLLIARGHLYGLGAELDSEPWHWRLYTGDAIPAAVLAYEAGAIPPPTLAPPAPVIRLGSSGDNVRRLQQLVNRQPVELGLGRLAVDGQAGPLTIAALRRLQNVVGVKADGIYGPITAAATTTALALGRLR
jgi:hypothetical protein